MVFCCLCGCFVLVVVDLVVVWVVVCAADLDLNLPRRVFSCFRFGLLASLVVPHLYVIVGGSRCWLLGRGVLLC